MFIPRVMSKDIMIVFHFFQKLKHRLPRRIALQGQDGKAAREASGYRSFTGIDEKRERCCDRLNIKLPAHLILVEENLDSPKGKTTDFKFAI